jgi:hypothetical protein
MDGATASGKSVFPPHQATANDLERLFAWVDRHGQFERFLPRLRARPKERDAAVAEIRAAWFLEALDFEIASWEPYITSQAGEFEIRWPGTPPLFVEVKGPTWESELTPEEQRGPRKEQARIIDGEGRWSAPSVEARAAAFKTMGKLTKDRPSMLVVMDRMFRSPAADLELADLTAVLSDPAFDGLGGILCIDASCFKNDGCSVDYRVLFAANPRAAGTPWELPARAALVLATAGAAIAG